MVQSQLGTALISHDSSPQTLYGISLCPLGLFYSEHYRAAFSTQGVQISFYGDFYRDVVDTDTVSIYNDCHTGLNGERFTCRYHEMAV